ncbi:prostaglandin E receptor 2a (subtype EP2) isoform X2 [Austrofundulus limnaeus]|uniref:Prostaglandin E receptor 2a (Subtype EP2) isoform X2 n=1 Tax=Austrofundulus limnaeus TaxID=52670 RepID=A0A2I4BEK7_AUSLI|nr:PREDICTED: prostaglandin E2 receptor EP2 subtype isoform X2 [Austrofundulus limnaeus]
MDIYNDTCHLKETLSPGESRLTSAIMFGLGIFGNITALVILEIRRRRNARARYTQRTGLFHILIMSLVVTDLTGTCMITPVVQLSYARNMTLVKMMPLGNGTSSVCYYFGVGMTFFSLATVSLLFAMALDRCFAIGYVQYCPGTWCFSDMNPLEKEDRAYANLYASILLVLVLTIVACNGFVVYHLYKMYKRRKRYGSVMVTGRSNNEHRTVSMVAEVEHLIMLVFMTIIFLICTLPLVIRVYINSIRTEESHVYDRLALLFISANSILDPWVFIIFSPGMLHFFGCSFKGRLGSVRGSMCRSSLTRENNLTHLELSRPAMGDRVYPEKNT